MTIRSKLRWLSVFQIAVWLLILPLFAIVVIWMSVIPREEALSREISVPAEWRLVTIGHGHATEWRMGTITERPVTFGLVAAALVALLAGFFWSIWFAHRLKGWKRGQYRDDDHQVAEQA